MPKEAASTLTWSAIHQTYTLSDRSIETTLTFDKSSPVWHEWLEQATSFAFRGRKGSYTARREQIKPGDWYWYAYQRSQKRVQKKYLGKSTALSLQRLEEVAARFTSKQEVEDEAVISSMQARISKMAQEQILAAKLRVPLLPQHLIARPHLSASSRRLLERPLTLLSAPAGSGKSTLVSSWLLDRSEPSAWLSLDQADNNPLRFWSYLFTTLDRLYPGTGTHALLMLRSLRVPTVEPVLTWLLNSLGNGEPATGEDGSEALLVLDDYHVISTEAIHRDMAFLIEHLPPHLHLIISTRHDPPLPLARFRVSNRLLELRAADLRFSREEIAVFFARHAGITLSTEEIVLLEERTEGWAAGLQLVALLLHDQQERPDILQSIHGSQHALAEYLGQEILAHLPEPVQHFLLRTSILEQLEGKLCEVVSGLADGEEILAWLFQANLFLTPLDESRRWYRYHQIFADVLRHQLRMTAAHIPELHRRASRWYRAQGMLADAVAHAHAAEDWEGIASIAEEAGVELMSRGETWMVMSWVSLLPRSLVFSRLRLFLFDCWYRWYNGQAAVVIEMFDEYARQHGVPDLEVEDAATLELAISTHVEALYPSPLWNTEQQANRIGEMLALYGALNMQRTDGAAFSKMICQRAMSHVAGLAHRARIVQHLGTVCMLRGELAEAVAVFEDALASAIADESATWITIIGHRLGTLYEMMGQLHNVERVAQATLQSTIGKEFLTQATAYLFLGVVAYQRNHLEAAERFFKLAIALREEVDLFKESGPYIPFLVGHLHLARIQLVRGERTGTRQSLEKIADSLSHSWAGAEILPVIKGEYALLMYELGDETAVRQWLEAFPPPEQSQQMLLRQFISLNPSHHLTYVAILRCCQRWQEAEQLAKNQQELAEQQGRTGNLIQWLTLRALLHQAQGDSNQALSTITRALGLAESRGYIRLFLDEGAPLLTLLYHLRNALRTHGRTEEPAPTLDYLERLILLLNQEQQTSQAVDEGASLLLVEPLSEREREVLWHLSEGRSNREIAEQLVIATSTVKSHIRAIYSKLGVNSRTQALARIRRLKQSQAFSSPE
ncbi:MAG TPA: LuxR C-terminal-related transcriptional regulator [Ktedonobacteraceae bacterium]|nr:LuxR C-terminal-related transcriptional regulator [Ktedonobacteraceae bacterium]